MPNEPRPIPTVEEVLAQIEREWTPDRFTTGTLSRNANKLSVPFYDPTAETFCAIGMLSLCTFDHRGFTENGQWLDENGQPVTHMCSCCAEPFPIPSELPSVKRQEFIAVKAVFEEAQRCISNALPMLESIVHVNDNRTNGYDILCDAIAKARQKLQETKTRD